MKFDACILWRTQKKPARARQTWQSERTNENDKIERETEIASEFVWIICYFVAAVSMSSPIIIQTNYIFTRKHSFSLPLSLFCSLSLGRFFVVQRVFLWMLFIFRTFNFCNAEFDGRTDQRGRSHVTLHNNNKFHYIHRRTQKYYANFFSLLFWVKPVRASQRTTI